MAKQKRAAKKSKSKSKPKLKAKPAAKRAKKSAKPKAKAKPKAIALQSTCSGGGPVIGIPAELAVVWRGTLPPVGVAVPAGWTWGTAGGPVCDYDRACDHIENRVATPYGGFGSVAVDSGLALIFECELSTTWVPTAEGGIVVRHALPESLAEALELIAAVPTAVWKPWPGQITLRDGRIFFFDSAMEGASDPSKIAASDGTAVGAPGPGVYAISTATDTDENDYIKLTRV